jgi:hypothetical protein
MNGIITKLNEKGALRGGLLLWLLGVPLPLILLFYFMRGC